MQLRRALAVIGVLVSPKRDLATTRVFFMRALVHGRCPTEVTTDQAPVYPRVIEELIPAACHVTEQYANNLAETLVCFPPTPQTRLQRP